MCHRGVTCHFLPCSRETGWARETEQMNRNQERVHGAGRRARATTYRRSGGLALLAGAAALALAGCGGSKSPSVANIATTTSSSAAGSTNGTVGGASSGSPPSQAQLQGDPLKYSECMRSNGVPNFPDPTAGGGFLFRASAGIDPSSPAFKAAQAKCQKLMPRGGPPGPGTATHPSAQALAQMVKVAECMRRHGISDFPDPRTSVPSNPFPAGSPGGVISDIDGVILVFPATIDTRSPLFTRAAAACGFPLHNH